MVAYLLAHNNVLRYYAHVIKSFRCKETERLFRLNSVRRFRAIESAARRKLEFLEAATSLNDLRNPPGNRLEILSGNRKGQYSIRINDPWRLCFKCNDGTENVKIVDYHR